MGDLVILIKYLELYDHHLLDYFSRKIRHDCLTFIITLALCLRRLLMCLRDLLCLDICCKQNRGVCGPLRLASFAPMMSFEVYPRRTLQRHFAPFFCRVVFHFTGGPRLASLFIGR